MTSHLGFWLKSFQKNSSYDSSESTPRRADRKNPIDGDSAWRWRSSAQKTKGFSSEFCFRSGKNLTCEKTCFDVWKNVDLLNFFGVLCINGSVISRCLSHTSYQNNA